MNILILIAASTYTPGMVDVTVDGLDLPSEFGLTLDPADCRVQFDGAEVCTFDASTIQEAMDGMGWGWETDDLDALITELVGFYGDFADADDASKFTGDCGMLADQAAAAGDPVGCALAHAGAVGQDWALRALARVYAA